MALIPRDDGPVRGAHDEAFWLWHMVNACSTVPGDGDVVLEYVQWAHLSLGAPVEGQRPNPGGPVRAVDRPVPRHDAPYATGRLAHRTPRSGDRLIGRQHLWTAVAPGTGDVDLLPGEYDAIRRYDTEDGTGASVLWRAGDLSVVEPVFAPARGTDPVGTATG
ncbi:hypothetical protein [Streptomyces sp. NPDC057580]|uniref:hypothetical protein n=1 Tax=Streptomyces sp. NPDC057580 TaxID=3346173 RepID=UPI0036B06DF1